MSLGHTLVRLGGLAALVAVGIGRDMDAASLGVIAGAITAVAGVELKRRKNGDGE